MCRFSVNCPPYFVIVAGNEAVLERYFTIFLDLHSKLKIGVLSVEVETNSPSQDHTHPDNHNLPTYHMTPGFKPNS